MPSRPPPTRRGPCSPNRPVATTPTGTCTRMPELPEVETIRRDLEKEVIGRRVKTVEVKGKRSVRRHKSGPEFRARLEGRKMTSVRRAGKYLLIGLDDDDLLVVHLGMSGQLL